MPPRVGHTRPLGTTRKCRFRREDWRADGEPVCGDVAVQLTGPGGHPHELYRAFLVVGVVETAAGGWNVTLERVAWPGETMPPGGERWEWFSIAR